MVSAEGRDEVDADSNANPLPADATASEALNTQRDGEEPSTANNTAISKDDSHATEAPNDQIDLHEGKQYDEDLRPYQRTLVFLIAPALLVNMPHPWAAFLCFIFLLLWDNVVCPYLLPSCPQGDHGQHVLPIVEEVVGIEEVQLSLFHWEYGTI